MIGMNGLCRWSLLFVLLLAVFKVSAEEPVTQLLSHRFFLTPTERALLDQARKPQTVAKSRATISAPRQKPQAEQKAIALDGLVQRSDGQSTVWINGEPQLLEGQSLSASDKLRLRLLEDERAGVAWVGSRQRVLRPGQVLNPSTGVINGVSIRPGED